MRLAIDPELSDDEFNRLWRKRKHGVVLAWLLPMVIVVSRLSQIERIVDWLVNWREKRRQKNAESPVAQTVSLPLTRENLSRSRKAA